MSVLREVHIDKETTKKLGGYFSDRIGYGVLWFDENADYCRIGAVEGRDSNGNLAYTDTQSVPSRLSKGLVIAYDIDWDVTATEIMESLDEMILQDAAEKAEEYFSIPEKTYINMHDEERKDAVYDAIYHCPALAYEFMNLPENILIPQEVVEEAAVSAIEDAEIDTDKDSVILDDGVISDWLSDEYGFCHNGFSLTSDKEQIKEEIER